MGGGGGVPWPTLPHFHSAPPRFEIEILISPPVGENQSPKPHMRKQKKKSVNERKVRHMASLNEGGRGRAGRADM